jgi:hypothetical protein
MRRIAIALVFVLATCGWSLAQDQLPDWVQVCTSQGSSTCAFTNNVTNGNIIYIFSHSEGTLASPTDTLSTSYSRVSSATTGGAHAYFDCGTLGSGGANTISFGSGTSFMGIIAIEYPSGYGVGCTTDGTTQTGQTASGTVTTSSLTPTVQNDLTFCFQTNFHSGSIPQSNHSGHWLDVMVENGSDSSGLAYQYTGTTLSSYGCTFVGGSDTNGNYILVALKPSALKVVTSSLPTAITSKSYKYCPQAIGGTGSSYTWSTSSGSLPSGLSWSSGCISGTPTGGTTTPTIQVSDGTNTATATLTLTVNSSENTPSLSGNTSSGSGLTGTCAIGDVTIVSQNFTNTSFVFPPTDTCSSTYKRVGTWYRVSGSVISQNQTIWLGVATATGSQTLTYSSGNSSMAVRFSNVQAFRDNAAAIDGNTTGSTSGPSIVTMAPDSEVWGGLLSGTNATFSAGTGWTLDATAAASGGVHSNQATVGTYNPTISSTGQSNWVFWGVMLRPSGSGAVAISGIRHKSQVF